VQVAIPLLWHQVQVKQVLVEQELLIGKQDLSRRLHLQQLMAKGILQTHQVVLLQ